MHKLFYIPFCCYLSVNIFQYSTTNKTNICVVWRLPGQKIELYRLVSNFRKRIWKRNQSIMTTTMTKSWNLFSAYKVLMLSYSVSHSLFPWVFFIYFSIFAVSTMFAMTTTTIATFKKMNGWPIISYICWCWPNENEYCIVLFNGMWMPISFVTHCCIASTL